MFPTASTASASASSTAGSVFSGIMDWFSHPFRTQGSALNWVLFIGLLIVAVWFWQVILLDLTRD